MRHQKIALASAALLTAALSGACTRPGGGGGGTDMPLRDCGTVDTAGGISAQERAAMVCWGGNPQGTAGYHTMHGQMRFKITAIDNGVTTVYETTGPAHQVKITTMGPNGAVLQERTCGTNQFVQSQVFFNLNTGKVGDILC